VLKKHVPSRSKFEFYRKRTIQRKKEKMCRKRKKNKKLRVKIINIYFLDAHTCLHMHTTYNLFKVFTNLQIFLNYLIHHLNIIIYKIVLRRHVPSRSK